MQSGGPLLARRLRIDFAWQSQTAVQPQLPTY